MTMPTPNDSKPQALTPDGLANQLFDHAFVQNPTDPRKAAGQVIEFLGAALFYAVTSSKNDVIVFLTETLIYVVSASSADDASRKEMLKKVGDTIANALPIMQGSTAKP